MGDGGEVNGVRPQLDQTCQLAMKRRALSPSFGFWRLRHEVFFTPEVLNERRLIDVRVAHPRARSARTCCFFGIFK